ncbi:MAG: SDR family NAD(P)-dependent oxidoreductase [Acidimicrobiia bacterium]|nr:SDR family NAD(P)-dependent oxidoreductase [Acidimicrobiia bacterium]
MKMRPSLTVVTGVTSGFGLEVVRHLAPRGHRLVLVARDRRRLDDLAADVSPTESTVLAADLSSVSEVARVVRAIAALDRPIGLLVNNVGAVYGLRRRTSVDAIEATMALNHLAPFQLTTGLLDQLVAGRARVVNVASDAYSFAGGRFDFDDWQGLGRYRPHRQYGRSKLANILFTRELQRRHGHDGIETVAWSPAGLTATRFGYGAHRLAPVAMKLTHPFALDTTVAVRPLLELCEADLGERVGRFVCGDHIHAVEPCVDDDAQRLWDLSEGVVSNALADPGRRDRTSGARPA